MKISAVARKISCVVLLVTLTACATQRPVLYPNKQYNRVGPNAAQQDIDNCIYQAKQAGARSGKGGAAAKSAAESAAVGGAAGAGYGAVRGDIGTSAAAGAAAAGAGSLMRSTIHSQDADPMFRRFVERCLKERGYEPMGWK